MRETFTESHSLVRMVGSILDHPAVFMGGPSRQARGKAIKVLQALQREGVLREPMAEAANEHRLLRDVGEAYQAVGMLLGALYPESDWPRAAEKLMDNLAAAAAGQPRPHDDLLPFILPE